METRSRTETVAETLIHRGGCHCGAVEFEVETPRRIEVERCNCSVCAMTGFLHLIVPAANFRLLRGEDELTLYQFNTRTARHLFCRRCGIKSYYVPRSNPDGYSVNFNCLRSAAFDEVRFTDFDGRNWELHGPALADRSAQ